MARCCRSIQRFQWSLLSRSFGDQSSGHDRCSPTQSISSKHPALSRPGRPSLNRYQHPRPLAEQTQPALLTITAGQDVQPDGHFSCQWAARSGPKGGADADAPTFSASSMHSKDRGFGFEVQKLSSWFAASHDHPFPDPFREGVCARRVRRASWRSIGLRPDRRLDLMGRCVDFGSAGWRDATGGECIRGSGSLFSFGYSRSELDCFLGRDYVFVDRDVWWNGWRTGLLREEAWNVDDVEDAYVQYSVGTLASHKGQFR